MFTPEAKDTRVHLEADRIYFKNWASVWMFGLQQISIECSHLQKWSDATREINFDPFNTDQLSQM